METAELKEKCREIITTHLKAKGYPNMSRRAIIEELKPMWVKMEEAGLVEHLKALGWKYEFYENAAVRAAQEAAIFETLGNFVRVNPRRAK